MIHELVIYSLQKCTQNCSIQLFSETISTKYINVHVQYIPKAHVSTCSYGNTLPCNSTILHLSLCWIPNLCKPLSLVYALATKSAPLFKYQSSTLNRATLYTMNKCTCTGTSLSYQLIRFCFTYVLI